MSDIVFTHYVLIAQFSIALTLPVMLFALLFIACLFIAVVVIFNVTNEGAGLELMRRWNN